MRNIKLYVVWKPGETVESFHGVTRYRDTMRFKIK